MKILYVDQTGQLGGGEIAILPWICHSREEAAVVLLEDGPFRSLLEGCGVPVEVINLQALKGVHRESGFKSILWTLPSFWRLRTQIAIRARGFDLLYANSQKAFLLSALSKKRKQPLIWHLRDILTAEHFSPVLRHLAVIFGNLLATLVIVNSQATAASFIAAGGDRRKVRVVYDGVSAEAFDQVTEAQAEAVRDSIAAPVDAKLVGLFGRISHWKGQHVLLEAVRELPGVHAVLVGEAIFGEAEYAERIRTLAASPVLAGRVHMLGFRSNVPALMKGMDVIVHTSTAPEPFGLVVVEGLLAGKPVIATAAGGVLEIVRGGPDGDVARLIAPGSAGELREAIRSLLADPVTAAELAQRGRQRAESAFSLEHLFHGLKAVFDSLDDHSS